MEKKIYDEMALRTFKANFEKVKANLMHVHECDLGSVDFRSELIVQLYKACDYRCLYRFMPVHEMTMMERSRIVSKCGDYILRDFICYFLNGEHFECLRRCCDGLYRDDDFEYYELGGLDKAEVKIYSEILDLKKPHRWFDGLSDELKRRFEEDKRKILSRYEYEEDNTITEARILNLMEWYCLGWKTVLEWIKDKHGLDVLTHFIWDTYVTKKDVSVVVGKELEDYIEFCDNDGDWMFDEFEVTIYECREQIRKWFDDPKVQKDFLLSGKDISTWLKEKNTEWRKVKRSSNWFHFNGKD